MLKTILLFFCLSLQAEWIQADSSEQSVTESSGFLSAQELVSDLIKKSAEFEGVLEQGTVLEVFENHFDFPVMARFILGRTAKKINEAQFEEFMSLFTELQALVLFPQLKQIDSFELLKTVSVSDTKTFLVFDYVSSNGLSVEIGAYFRTDKEGFVKIYDVQIEGVRILLSWRAQIKSLVKKNGFEGMVQKLRDQLEKKSSHS